MRCPKCNAIDRQAEIDDDLLCCQYCGHTRHKVRRTEYTRRVDYVVVDEMSEQAAARLMSDEHLRKIAADTLERAIAQHVEAFWYGDATTHAHT